ncbi:MAG: peptidylprolyl isomerase [Clostridia bacterium]|nr:peptidylprolyl isomerase [Clostridia bacterium]
MSDNQNPIVTITTQCGAIKIELYPDSAPNTVNNFLSLIAKGFYNGLIFHRVIKGFMIQGGDPAGTGMGGPNYTIAGEFKANGYPNDIKHLRGVISMARSQNFNSAGSQFFIMHENAPHLDGQYAAFGKVIEGIEAVDEIAKCAVKGDRPIKNQTIQSITAETFGVNYPQPQTLKRF